MSMTNRSLSGWFGSTNRCLTRWTSFKNRRLLRVSFSAKFRKQRKIRKGKSRCRKPSRQKIYDSGKSKNTNPAVENRAGRGIMTAGNWIMQIPLWWRGILWVKASEIKKSADPDAHFDNFKFVRRKEFGSLRLLGKKEIATFQKSICRKDI